MMSYKLTEKSQINKLVILANMAYFSSYITRINFAAVISEFITCEGVLKSSAAVITTAAFITYGLGQIVSGYLGDKLNPRLLIFYGSLCTISMNVLLTLVSPNILPMTIVWAINGFAQAFMWPPLVKIFMHSLSSEDYSKNIVKVAYGSALGTMAVYLISPLIINVLSWKYVMLVSAGFGLIFAVIWLIYSNKLIGKVDFKEKIINTEKKAETVDTFGVPVKIMYSVLPMILISISLQGMIRDGISTWFPSFISETFNISNSSSILSAVALPIFHLVCSLLTYRILKALKNNVFMCLTMFFLIISFLLCVLKFFGTGIIPVAVVSLAFANGFSHSINLLQTSYIPKFFKSTGKVSFFAGLLNAATYIGSAVSTYGFALITEKAGWNATTIAWIGVSSLGAAICFICAMVIKKKNQMVEN